MKIKSILIIITLLLANISYAGSIREAKQFYAEEQYQQAFSIFDRLAKMGSKEAQDFLGRMYQEGLGVEKDLVSAHAWSTLLGLSGNELALERRQKLDSLLSQKQKDQANEAYLMLNQNYGDAAIRKKYFFISELDETGDYIPPKFLATAFSRSSIRLYPLEKATEFALVSFDVDALGNSRNHRVEFSSNRNRKKSALKIVGQARYKPAMIGGKGVASYRLSLTIGFTRNGDYFIVNDKNAIAVTYRRILEELTTKEVREASFVSEDFALMTLESDKSKSLADITPLEWLKVAASQGEPLAQREIGLLHLHGDISARSITKAIFWLEAASENGDDTARYVLGLLALEQGSLSGLKFLKTAAKSMDEADLALAWHYATSVDRKSKRELADHYFSKVKRHLVNDHFTYYQVRAAIEAEQQDYKSARKSMKKAMKIGKAFDFNLNDVERYQALLDENTEIRINR